jgi:16S rRNA (guanine966-N2)-methyltransferase
MTRPTSDRVREALMAIVGDRLPGARVLDLYAGTGALGLEALSRGAREATFVERSREALEALRANVSALAVEQRVCVVAAAAERAVSSWGSARRGRSALPPQTPGHPAGPFDLVFADPPYAEVESAVRVLEDIVRLGALAKGAMVVLEHAPARRRVAGEEQEGPEITGLQREDTRRYGDSCLSFYGYAL